MCDDMCDCLLYCQPCSLLHVYVHVNFFNIHFEAQMTITPISHYYDLIQVTFRTFNASLYIYFSLDIFYLDISTSDCLVFYIFYTVALLLLLFYT